MKIGARDDKYMLIIDPEKCIGCGLCVSIAPDVFEMDLNSGKAVVKTQDFTAHEVKVQEAIDSCPVQAISK